MRDIHIPPVEQSVIVSGYALTPLVLFAGLVLAGLWQIWRRRNYWKREAKLELTEVEERVRAGELITAWRQLASLVRRIAIKLTSESHVAGQTGEQWLLELDALFQTNEFAGGCGRGLIHYPYVEQSDPPREDIVSLIDLVGSRIDRMKVVP